MESNSPKEESKTKKFSGRTALLVDDDSDFIYQHSIILEEVGFKVIKATSAKTAKMLIQKEQFDIAILDLMMDEVDAGLTLSYEIKKIKDKNIPVILVTGVTSQTKLHFDKNGTGGGKGKKWLYVDGILNKPIRGEEIVAELKRHLS